MKRDSIMINELKMTAYTKLQLFHLLVDKDEELLLAMGCSSIPRNTIAVFINDLRWCISRMNPAKLVNVSDIPAYGFKYKLAKHRRQRIIVIDVNDRQFIITLRWTQHGKNTRDSYLSDLSVGIVEYLGGQLWTPVDVKFLHAKVNRLRDDHSVFFRIMNKATEDLANAPSMGINKTHYGQTLIDWLYKLGEGQAPHIDTHKEEKEFLHGTR